MVYIFVLIVKVHLKKRIGRQNQENSLSKMLSVRKNSGLMISLCLHTKHSVHCEISAVSFLYVIELIIYFCYPLFSML